MQPTAPRPAATVARRLPDACIDTHSQGSEFPHRPKDRSGPELRRFRQSRRVDWLPHHLARQPQIPRDRLDRLAIGVLTPNPYHRLQYQHPDLARLVTAKRTRLNHRDAGSLFDADHPANGVPFARRSSDFGGCYNGPLGAVASRGADPDLSVGLARLASQLVPLNWPGRPIESGRYGSLSSKS